VEELPLLRAAAERCYASLRDKVGAAEAKGLVGEGERWLQPAAWASSVECAQEALDGVNRIKDIARGLGTFSRVETSALSLVDLPLAIEAAANLAQNELKYRARLVKDLAAVPKVLASEGKLAQVFLNLLVNAAHAIGEGHVETNRILLRTWADGEYVCAEVNDTGKDISPENLARIFEPFFTTKALGVGTGLGLAICKNIVTQFGGEIRVESEVGKGARFVIRLPASRAAADPARASSGTSPLAPAAIRGRLLIIDDEASIRRMLQVLLGQDHEIVVAASGLAAKAVLEQDRAFDVVLCDLIMPELTGMELHEWLAACDPAAAARMVFFSGGAFTPGASDYLARVPITIIDKPADAAALRTLVAERVRERRDPNTSS
jgi:CheY-like chemotaxis protein/anti-sigma regulatory factor (Ser/Thr protein kinase)